MYQKNIFTSTAPKHENQSVGIYMYEKIRVNPAIVLAGLKVVKNYFRRVGSIKWQAQLELR